MIRRGVEWKKDFLGIIRAHVARNDHVAGAEHLIGHCLCCAVWNPSLTSYTIAANLSSQFLFMLSVIYGFGAFLAKTPQLYFAMRIAGAIYLMYVGIKFFRNAGKATDFSVDRGAIVHQPSVETALYRGVSGFLQQSEDNPLSVRLGCAVSVYK